MNFCANCRWIDRDCWASDDHCFYDADSARKKTCPECDGCGKVLVPIGRGVRGLKSAVCSACGGSGWKGGSA